MIRSKRWGQREPEAIPTNDRSKGLQARLVLAAREGPGSRDDGTPAVRTLDPIGVGTRRDAEHPPGLLEGGPPGRVRKHPDGTRGRPFPNFRGESRRDADEVEDAVGTTIPLGGQ